MSKEESFDALLVRSWRLRNIALQSIDRSASPCGLVAHVVFLDPDVVDYVMRIPARFRLQGKGEMIEKWILRQVLADAFPNEVLWRHKAKFWQVAGVGEVLAQYAEECSRK